MALRRTLVSSAACIVKVKINLDGDSKLAIEGTLRLEGLLPDFKRTRNGLRAPRRAAGATFCPASWPNGQHVAEMNSDCAKCLTPGIFSAMFPKPMSGRMAKSGTPGSKKSRYSTSISLKPAR